MILCCEIRSYRMISYSMIRYHLKSKITHAHFSELHRACFRIINYTRNIVAGPTTQTQLYVGHIRRIDRKMCIRFQSLREAAV